MEEEKRPLIEQVREDFKKMKALIDRHMTIERLFSSNVEDQFIKEFYKMSTQILALANTIEARSVENKFGDILETDKNCGRLVKVRLAQKGEVKTHLGVYLGKIPTTSFTDYDPTTQIVTVKPSMKNPMMYVPDLGRIVFGFESWWGFIELEEAKTFSPITQEDIQNSPAVVMASAMLEAEGKEFEKQSPYKCFLGNPLYIGDKVCFAHNQLRKLAIGKLISLGPKMGTIEFESNGITYTLRQFYYQMTKI